MTKHIQITPENTAILLLHFQVGTLSAGNALALADDASLFAERMRTAGATITFVNLGFDESESNAVPSSNPMLSPLVASGMMRLGSPEASNPPVIEPKSGDLVVRSTRLGSFSTTSLESILRERGIRSVVLTGVATGAVVLATALEMSDHDFEVIVTSDLVADPDPVVNAAVLEGIAPRIGQVIHSDGITT